MKILLDQNISYRVKKIVSSEFPDISHVSDHNLIDVNDKIIWDYAKKNSLAVITHDNDFDDFVNFFGFPPKIIKLETGNITNLQTANVLINHKKEIKEFLDSNNIGLLVIQN